MNIAIYVKISRNDSRNNHNKTTFSQNQRDAEKLKAEIATIRYGKYIGNISIKPAMQANNRFANARYVTGTID